MRTFVLEFFSIFVTSPFFAFENDGAWIGKERLHTFKEESARKQKESKLPRLFHLQLFLPPRSLSPSLLLSFSFFLPLFFPCLPLSPSPSLLLFLLFLLLSSFCFSFSSVFSFLLFLFISFSFSPSPSLLLLLLLSIHPSLSRLSFSF